MKKLAIGITGATGGIGQHFLREISKKDVEVYALVRRRSEYKRRNIHFILGELLDMIALEKFVKKSDVILHLAAHHPTSFSVASKEQELNQLFGVNSCGTAILAKLVEKYDKQMIYASTAGVYELSERKKGEFSEQEFLPARTATDKWISNTRQLFEKTINEWINGDIDNFELAMNNILQSYPPPDESIYSLSKFLGEHWVKQLKNSVIFRFSDIYGPGGRTERIIPKAMQSLLNKKEIIIEFGPRQIVQFIYISDIIRHLETAVFTKNLSLFPKIINISTFELTDKKTLARYFETMSMRAGQASNIKISQPVPIENSRYYKIENMEHYLGLNITTLSNGLDRMFNCLKHKKNKPCF